VESPATFATSDTACAHCNATQYAHDVTEVMAWSCCRELKERKDATNPAMSRILQAARV
jgi:hypothetical protein